MKFKRGDIVVITNHKDIHHCWFEKIPINLITKITGTFPENLKKEAVVIRMLDYKEISTTPDTLRLATQREQFLYHILGLYVLGEEDEI